VSSIFRAVAQGVAVLCKALTDFFLIPESVSSLSAALAFAIRLDPALFGLDSMTITFTSHALEQAELRGTNKAEIALAIEQGEEIPAKKGRFMTRKNFEFNSNWQGKRYKIKQVAPVFVKENEKIVVITVYTFYF
jgi:hypothetical protein